MSTNKELLAKIERVHSARMKVEGFVITGGNLKSKEAVPIGMELAAAFSDLFTEFGAG